MVAYLMSTEERQNQHSPRGGRGSRCEPTQQRQPVMALQTPVIKPMLLYSYQRKLSALFALIDHLVQARTASTGTKSRGR